MTLYPKIKKPTGENLEVVTVVEVEEIVEETYYSYLPAILSNNKSLEKRVIAPTATPTLTATPMPRERYVRLSISSPAFSERQKNSWREYVYILYIEDSSNPEEIMELLGEAFSQTEFWVAVQSGQVIWTHQGWSTTKGAEFGYSLWIAISKEASLDLCLDSSCYTMVKYVFTEQEQITLEDFFEIEESDLFIITCGDLGINRVIIQLKLVQTNG